MQVINETVAKQQPNQIEESSDRAAKFEVDALITVTTQISFASILTIIQALPKLQKWQIYQTLVKELIAQSAEAKAIARLEDEDDESKWITAIEEGEEVDVEANLEYLRQRGYKVEVSAEAARSSATARFS
jgi:predicted hydrolase (HD superfamily)